MVLAKLGVIKDKSLQIESVAAVLSRLRQRLNPEVKPKDNQNFNIQHRIIINNRIESHTGGSRENGPVLFVLCQCSYLQPGILVHR